MSDRNLYDRHQETNNLEGDPQYWKHYQEVVCQLDSSLPLRWLINRSYFLGYEHGSKDFNNENGGTDDNYKT